MGKGGAGVGVLPLRVPLHTDQSDAASQPPGIMPQPSPGTDSQPPSHLWPPLKGGRGAKSRLSCKPLIMPLAEGQDSFTAERPKPWLWVLWLTSSPCRVPAHRTRTHPNPPLANGQQADLGLSFVLRLRDWGGGASQCHDVLSFPCNSGQVHF